MSKDGLSFEGWLERARLQRERLTTRQISVLEAAFQFLEHGGHDYASRRLVEHFLLHSGLGLKVAQVARLVGLDRCTPSRHRPCSSTQVVQAIHNRHPASSPVHCFRATRARSPSTSWSTRTPPATKCSTSSNVAGRFVPAIEPWTTFCVNMDSIAAAWRRVDHRPRPTKPPRHPRSFPARASGCSPPRRNP